MGLGERNSPASSLQVAVCAAALHADWCWICSVRLQRLCTPPSCTSRSPSARLLLLVKPTQACQPNPTTGRGTSEAAAAAERHYSLTGQHGVWARARRLATLDFWFDSLDEVFEAGDNVDLTVSLVLAADCKTAKSSGGQRSFGWRHARMHMQPFPLHSLCCTKGAHSRCTHLSRPATAGGGWPAAHAGPGAVAPPHGASAEPSAAVCAGAGRPGTSARLGATASPAGARASCSSGGSRGGGPSGPRCGVHGCSSSCCCSRSAQQQWQLRPQHEQHSGGRSRRPAGAGAAAARSSRRQRWHVVTPGWLPMRLPRFQLVPAPLVIVVLTTRSQAASRAREAACSVLKSRVALAAAASSTGMLPRAY